MWNWAGRGHERFFPSVVWHSTCPLSLCTHSSFSPPRDKNKDKTDKTLTLPNLMGEGNISGFFGPAEKLGEGILGGNSYSWKGDLPASSGGGHQPCRASMSGGHEKGTLAVSRPFRVGTEEAHRVLGGWMLVQGSSGVLTLSETVLL